MASRNNVVALPNAELPGLPVAATSGTGNRISGSRNEIWLCPAYSNGEPVMLYVKLGLSTRAMLVEALCAQIAQGLKLGSPTPFIVTVNPKHVGRAPGSSVLAFGAEDLCERSMAKPLRNLETLLALLRSHKIADLVTVFDEWIANDVRNPSDILVSPEARLYMIDHEASIADGLRPDQEVTNWLAGRLLESMSDTDRIMFLRQLRARIAALHRVSLTAVPLATQYSPEGVQLYETLLQFLRTRLHHLDELLSRRVMPEQGYLQATEPEDPTTISDASF